MATGAVVITGTSSGIGRASALALARLGFQVFGEIRRDSDAESVRSESAGRVTRLARILPDRALDRLFLRMVGLATTFGTAGGR